MPPSKDRFPQGRCECGHDLAEATDLGIVDRYQQHEIPQISVSITQYDQHQVRCGCGQVHTADRPEGARAGVVGYGPNLQSFAVYLMVVHFVPAQRCVGLLESLTGAAPSVGFVHGMLTRASNLLVEVDKRIRALITLAYPDADWPTQIVRALRGLIHHANLARDAGRDTIDAAVRDRLIKELSRRRLVGSRRPSCAGRGRRARRSRPSARRAGPSSR